MTDYTLMIRSQPLIYVPGFFAWVENAIRTDMQEAKINDFLDALGIPTHLWEKVKTGKYEKSTEGEDLVLVFKDHSSKD